VDRLYGGRSAWLASVDRELAGIAWLFAPGDPGALAPLAADEREFSFSFVLPAWRRRGVHRALMAARVAHCDAAGIRQIVAYVRRDNAPSVRAHEAFGFRQGGTLEVRRVLGVKFRR
jgi:GNAT superfamily N-acetyltransferase